MKKDDLKKRWNDSKYYGDIKMLFEMLSRGGDIWTIPSPFGLCNGRIDYRGLILPSFFHINRCCFEHVDFSCSIFSNVRVEQSGFKDVLFNECDLSCFIDMGNNFYSSSFVKTDFSKAGIGYQGSSYTDCNFQNSRFKRTHFIRSVFRNSTFNNCTIKNNQFNASAFELCSFIGKIDGVSFSNGYFLGTQLNSKFGIPRENKMFKVSFAKAELKSIDFRWNCDLSTVIMPEKGDYRRYDCLPQRLEFLKSRLDEFPDSVRESIDQIFLQIYFSLATSLRQEMYIFNCDEIRNEFGRVVGQKLIDILDEYI